jgi:hypothetical protein
MDSDEFVALLFNQNLHSSLDASLIDWRSTVNDELARQQNIISLNDLKPDGIVSLLISRWEGSLLIESGNGSAVRIKDQIRTIYEATPEALITSTTLSNIAQRDGIRPATGPATSRWIPSWAPVPTSVDAALETDGRG